MVGASHSLSLGTATDALDICHIASSLKRVSDLRSKLGSVPAMISSLTGLLRVGDRVKLEADVIATKPAFPPAPLP